MLALRTEVKTEVAIITTTGMVKGVDDSKILHKYSVALITDLGYLRFKPNVTMNIPHRSVT